MMNNAAAIINATFGKNLHYKNGIGYTAPQKAVKGNKDVWPL